MKPKRATRGLALIGVGMLCIIGWVVWNDVAFALLAKKVAAKVVSYEVTREAFGHGGTFNVPAVTGVALVPRVTLRSIDVESSRGITCTAGGKLAVFGYRSVPERDFGTELALLQRTPQIDAFVKERRQDVECRLSRAIDPGILLLAAFVLIVTAASAVANVKDGHAPSER